jgi:hypothetical protein
MTPYIVIFAVITFLCYHNSGHNISKKGLAIIFAVLALFVGCSDMLGGYDRYIYCSLFDGLADSWSKDINIENQQIFKLFGSEIGYIYSNVLISFITSNRYIFVLLYTLVAYCLFFRAISTQTNNYLFATLIFLGLYFFYTFTYLRQVMAVAILWNSTKYIVDRKLIKFLLCVALAASFHNSALLFFPVYWLCNRRYSITLILIVLACCFALGFADIPSAIFDMYGDVSDNQDRASIYMDDVSGFRIEYVLEALFFSFIILTKYRSIPDSTRYNVPLNISLFFCAILLLFCKSINGGRLSWPFMMGIISTVSYVMTYKNFVTLKMMGFTLVIFLLYLRIIVSWGTLLCPYKTFFTDGFRAEDSIYRTYEYDHRYDNDKFYR